MTKDEALKKIEELKAFIEQEEKPKEYFMIDSNGYVFRIKRSGELLYQTRHSRGNVFPDEKSAKRRAAYNLKTSRFINKALELANEYPLQRGQTEYTVIYNKSNSTWYIDIGKSLFVPALSYQSAEHLIDWANENYPNGLNL